MININLLPKEIIERQKLKSLISLVSLCAIIVASILLIIYIMQRFTLINLEAELHRIERELKEMQSVVNEVNQLKENKKKLEARKGLVERLLSNGLVYPKFMAHLLQILPENVWLISMNTTTSYDNVEGRITGLKVTLTCSSYDKISIADFLSNLENSDKFENPKLGPINISQQDKYELHNFTVEFMYVVK